MELKDIDILAGSTELIIELLLVGFVFFLIEKIRPAESGIKFFKSDFKNDLGLVFINSLIIIPIFTLLIYGLFEFIIEPVITKQLFAEEIAQLPVLLQTLMAIFIIDFAAYWRHRLTHHYLWNVHSVHHSAEHIGWLTAMRLHPVDMIVVLFFNLCILYFIGFSGAAMTFAIIILKLYNYFTHANLNLQFGKPMRYILASPNFHRWHHANDVKAYDKNFCAMFSCIDLMFGTYYHPENQLPESYGIGKDAQEKYPKTFLGQLTYPFRKHK